MKETTRKFYHGLIKLLVLEELKTKGQSWDHMLFWNQFEQEIEPPGKKEKEKRVDTPRSNSSKRRRRAISPVPIEQLVPTSRKRKSKKKLDFT